MEIQCAKEIINSLLLLHLFKEVLSTLPLGGRGSVFVMKFASSSKFTCQKLHIIYSFFLRRCLRLN
jgi:hypothetical protein